MYFGTMCVVAPPPRPPSRRSQSKVLPRMDSMPSTRHPSMRALLPATSPQHHPLSPSRVISVILDPGSWVFPWHRPAGPWGVHTPQHVLGLHTRRGGMERANGAVSLPAAPSSHVLLHPATASRSCADPTGELSLPAAPSSHVLLQPAAANCRRLKVGGGGRAGASTDDVLSQPATASCRCPQTAESCRVASGDGVLRPAAASGRTASLDGVLLQPAVVSSQLLQPTKARGLPLQPAVASCGVVSTDSSLLLQPATASGGATSTDGEGMAAATLVHLAVEDPGFSNLQVAEEVPDEMVPDEVALEAYLGVVREEDPDPHPGSGPDPNPGSVPDPHPWLQRTCGSHGEREICPPRCSYTNPTRSTLLRTSTMPASVQACSSAGGAGFSSPSSVLHPLLQPRYLCSERSLQPLWSLECAATAMSVDHFTNGHATADSAATTACATAICVDRFTSERATMDSAAATACAIASRRSPRDSRGSPHTACVSLHPSSTFKDHTGVLGALGGSWARTGTLVDQLMGSWRLVACPVAPGTNAVMVYRYESWGAGGVSHGELGRCESWGAGQV